MQLKFESTLWVSTTPLVNGVHCKSVLCVYMISLMRLEQSTVALHTHLSRSHIYI